MMMEIIKYKMNLLKRKINCLISMFKLIKLGKRSLVDSDKILVDRSFITNPYDSQESIKISELIQKEELLKDQNFHESRVSMNGEDFIDHENRLCFEHNETFNIVFNEEDNLDIKEFFESNKIKYSNELSFNLLKYKKGDFFNDHIDICLDGSHKFNCLIFLKNNELEGGDLVFHDKDNTFKIIFEPSKIDCNVMLIYSIDLFHKVEPVEKGIRLVFKKHLYVQNCENSNESDDQNNCDLLMDNKFSCNADY